MLDKPSQPRMINMAEKVADVRIEHPVHPLPLDPDREGVQRIMRAAPRPEPIREAPEAHLVDGVEHLDDRPLNDLVLQRRDPQRPACDHQVSGCTLAVSASPGSAPTAPDYADPGDSSPGSVYSRPTSPSPPPARPLG